MFYFYYYFYCRFFYFIRVSVSTHHRLSRKSVFRDLIYQFIISFCCWIIAFFYHLETWFSSYQTYLNAVRLFQHGAYLLESWFLMRFQTWYSICLHDDRSTNKTNRHNYPMFHPMLQYSHYGSSLAIDIEIWRDWYR